MEWSIGTRDATKGALRTFKAGDDKTKDRGTFPHALQAERRKEHDQKSLPWECPCRTGEEKAPFSFILAARFRCRT